MKRILIVLAVLLFKLTLGQNNKVDSLIKIIKNSKEDTSKVNALMNLSIRLFFINPDTCIKLSNQSLALAKKLNRERGVALSEHQLGNLNYIKSNYPEAIKHYENAIQIWDKMIADRNESNSRFGSINKIRSNSNIGSVYKDMGNYVKGLEYCLSALSQAEKFENRQLTSLNLNNIGVIYQLQKNYDKAIEYNKRSLEFSKKDNDAYGIVVSMANISAIYMSIAKYSEALNLCDEVLKLYEQAGNKQGIANTLGNMGAIYSDMGDSAVKRKHQDSASSFYFPKALNYFLQSLKMKREFGEQSQIAITCNNIGGTYLRLKDYPNAKKFLTEGKTVAEQINATDVLKYSELFFSELYEVTNQPLLALQHYKRHISIKDSLNNDEIVKNQLRAEMSYDFEKKELATKAEQEKKDIIANEQKQGQRLVLIFVVIGLLGVLVFSVLLYKRFRESQKQKIIIEKQKNLVEIKNREVLDSISYAKRIQNAILPPLRLVKEYLPQSFIIYKPKDIVAGDFYWMENSASVFLFAAADCTGHGVPGAMVSVLCHNSLNRSVREFSLSDPGKILDKTRDLIIEEFRKSDDDVKDGMDISMCALSLKTKHLSWSGANNPLWIIRKNGTEVEEIKPDKQPIGKYSEARPFTTHKLQLEEGDSIYIFTDGFQDQFGGSKGKKYKASKMKELLISIKHKDMEAQCKDVESAFELWKGQLEQVDDVCFIGVRV
jgi:serine phosphatase RsbU (regulator of sigma subunit)